MIDFSKLTTKLDNLATVLEEKGLTKEAANLDLVSNTLDRIATRRVEAKKKEKKWIQKAVSEETEGDFGTWCKRNGFKGVCQACINKAAETGGRAAKMALFAANVSKGKYTYPKQDKDK